MLIAAFRFDLAAVGTIAAIAVVLSGVGAVFVVRSMRSALGASQETVDTLMKARVVAKEDLEDERARWEAKVDALETKVLALEATVTGLRGQIVEELLTATQAALRTPRQIMRRQVAKGGGRAKSATKKKSTR